jgi:hypothetical protein
MKFAVWLPALLVLGLGNADAFPLVMHGATSWQSLFLLRIIVLVVAGGLAIAIARGVAEAKRWFGQGTRP